MKTTRTRHGWTSFRRKRLVRLVCACVNYIVKCQFEYNSYNSGRTATAGNTFHLPAVVRFVAERQRCRIEHLVSSINFFIHRRYLFEQQTDLQFSSLHAPCWRAKQTKATGRRVPVQVETNLQEQFSDRS